MWKIPGTEGDDYRRLRGSEIKAMRRYVNAYGGVEAFRRQLEGVRYIVVAKNLLDDLAVQWNPFDHQFYLRRVGHDKGDFTIAEEVYPTFDTMIARIIGG